MIAALTSTVLFAVQNIYSKKLMRQRTLDHMNLLYHSTRASFMLFFPFWAFTGIEGLRMNPCALVHEHMVSLWLPHVLLFERDFCLALTDPFLCEPHFRRVGHYCAQERGLVPESGMLHSTGLHKGGSVSKDISKALLLMIPMCFSSAPKMCRISPGGQFCGDSGSAGSAFSGRTSPPFRSYSWSRRFRTRYVPLVSASAPCAARLCLWPTSSSAIVTSAGPVLRIETSHQC